MSTAPVDAPVDAREDRWDGACEAASATARTTGGRRWSDRRWAERRWPTRVFAWLLAITAVLSPAVHFPPAWVLGCIGGFFLAAVPPLRAELYPRPGQLPKP